MFSFFYRKKDENTTKALWEKISKSITNKTELSNLSENFNSFYKLIKADTKKIYSENINYIKDNDILNQIVKFSINNPDLRPILLEYLSLLLNQLKYINYIFENNDELFISLQRLVICLKSELDQKTYKFQYKNESANLFNSLTRILFNYPSMLSYFIIKTQKLYINEEYDDFIIFSCLLKLLELDQSINNYNIRKNIRRSLIVFLSFDDINKNNYLLNDSFIVEILVDKLCIYYQMLPSFFDINENAKSIEPYANINLNCFRTIYFDYKDYIIFLDKIISCFTNIKLKVKFQNYFFNKFLLENILPILQSHNLKKFRTNLQYLITLLKFSKNNIIIINPLSYFLLGLIDENNNNIPNHDNEENNDNSGSNIQSNNNSQINDNEISEESSYNNIFYIDYLLAEYDPNKMRNKILMNIHKTKEHLNIIIYELFNIFFKEKPYLTMQNFVKPYTDLVINKSNNKAKFIFEKNTIYPESNQLWTLLDKYLNKNNFVNNIECLLFNNISFYKNHDINFYSYYVNNKKREDLIMNQSQNNLNNNNEDASFRINEDYSYSEENANNQEILEENIMKGLNPNFIKNLLIPNGNEPKKVDDNKLRKIRSEGKLQLKDIFESDRYVKEDKEENNYINIDYNINFDYEKNLRKNKKDIKEEENEESIDLLLMKNLHHKLVNYEKNTNLENILLFNLMITIFSIPNFSFDNDLLKCNLVLLDNDDKSKYSFFTIFKYNSNLLIDKLKYSENEINLKLMLKEFGLLEPLNEKEKFKIGLDLQGFKNVENMSQKEKENNQIINWIIFCEFIKEFIACISQKYKFEETIERLFNFYSEQLDEFYNDNINDEEENENENENNENNDNIF